MFSKINDELRIVRGLTWRSFNQRWNSVGQNYAGNVADFFQYIAKKWANN